MKTRYLIHADKTHLPVPLSAGIVQVPDGCRMVTTDDDGWIEWYGGKCPLRDGVGCGIRTGYGSDLCERPEMWRWTHRQDCGDITAYRPIHNLILERL